MLKWKLTRDEIFIHSSKENNHQRNIILLDLLMKPKKLVENEGQRNGEQWPSIGEEDEVQGTMTINDQAFCLVDCLPTLPHERSNLFRII